MSFFEWFGESFKPGPVGGVSSNDDDSWQPKNKFVIWALTMVGAAIFCFFVWSIFQTDARWQWAIALLIYLIISRIASPRPDYSNMGWAGGLLDNPFRISDDFNRMLWLFAFVLIPGKIIVYAFQTIINTIRTL